MIYDVELLNDNINMTMIVAHLLTLAAMVYVFTHQARKLVAKMDILTIKVAVSTEAELSSQLLNVKQVKSGSLHFCSRFTTFFKLAPTN